MARARRPLTEASLQSNFVKIQTGQYDEADFEGFGDDYGRLSIGFLKSRNKL